MLHDLLSYNQSMDKLAESLTSFPSSPTLPDHELTRQANYYLTNVLHKVSAAALKQTINGIDLLDLLNPEFNSLGYLYAL